MSESYHTARLPHDPKRSVVWRALWNHYFRYIVKPTDCVLDLGCGYGDFINSVVAKRRIAVDRWPGFTRHVSPAVEKHVGPASDLQFIDEGSLDFVFASNLFEHLAPADLREVLHAIRTRLAPTGTLNILQPNWRYAFREYWDDYTHVTPWSDTGLRDFLHAEGFEVFLTEPRFLPLTLKSRLPASPLLIRMWLASPVKLGGKQMFLRARRKGS